MSLERTAHSRSGACCGRLGIWLLPILIPVVLGVTLYGAGAWFFPTRTVQAANHESSAVPRDEEDKPIPAPELDGGVAWLNTASPIRMKDLRGKVVILDFWTFCCINCIHTLPDLAKLEKKYEKQLVVIGVHSAKFDSEKKTKNIRKAILRYEITHPVVNDAEMKIWRRYGANSWPTLVLIDPEGNYVGWTSGEGNYETLDKYVGELVKKHRKKKTLNEKPLKFKLASEDEDGSSPLFFPGKVLADEKSNRLFIADSTHHRIVVTDLQGKKIAVIGKGVPGNKDGAYGEAQFNDPQGLVVRGDVLYVADRKNHLIRAVNLKKRTVETVAGTGKQGFDRFRGGDALKTGLNSPWALHLDGDRTFIAMAGHHQLWVMDLKKKTVVPYAGNGRESLVDDSLENSEFAQPSGLTSDGKTLYVADSEVSAIRAVPLNGKDEVETLIGKNLFTFGDKDGTGDAVRIQHALGVEFHKGKIYVADTYNSKIKVLDPKTRKCDTLLGGGEDGWLGGPLFNEPAGLSIAKGKLYVADTNAHRIRVIDLKSSTVSTLKLQGVEAPKTP